MDPDTSDERYVELETLEAIFPEIQKLNTGNLVSISLDIPVHPATPVTVTFPAASSPAAPSLAGAEPRVDSHELAHLPAVTLNISLPEGYPAEKPPIFDISTNPSWLPPARARHLEEEGLRMWADLGHNLVAYDFIDHVQQKADQIFDMVDGDNNLKIDSLHKIAILDYDIKARKAAFDKETFDCGVCIEPKKGAACHKMLDCGHVFCKACLQDFYNNAITEGDLSVVRCLFPDCAKKRAAAPEAKKRKVKTHILPSELLLMGLSQEVVARYVTLKYKNELESDKNTIYCPRSWCNGAARSKKHKKPQGLELGEASEDESDAQDEKGNGEKKQKKAPKKGFDAADLLAICEDCGLAFCSRCLQSWHGEFFRCAPKRDKDEITAEEQASLDYLRLYTSPCPTCAAPVQKTHGCNHMICFRCNDHFCYLCSAWLDASNPYKHFNIQDDGRITQCYMRLFDLERGDGDHAGHFDDGNIGQDNVEVVRDFGEEEVLGLDAASSDEEEEPPRNDPPHQDNRNAAVDADADAPIAPPAGPPAGAVAREAPLVLRIGGDPVPRGGRHAAPPAAPPARGRGGHRGPNPARGGRGRGNRGGGRGRGGAQPVLPAAFVHHQRGNRIRPNLQPNELDPQQEEWVRNFVRLALLDEEESGDDDFGR